MFIGRVIVTPIYDTLEILRTLLRWVYAYANCRALHRGNNGLLASMDSQRETASSVNRMASVSRILSRCEFPCDWTAYPSLWSLFPSPGSRSRPMLRSAPAQNVRPAPVTTTALTLSSMLNNPRALIISSSISTVKALCFSGRLIVSTITAVTPGAFGGCVDTKSCRHGRVSYDSGTLIADIMDRWIV